MQIAEGLALTLWFLQSRRSLQWQLLAGHHPGYAM